MLPHTAARPAGTRSGSQFGAIEETICGPASPLRDLKAAATKTPSPRAEPATLADDSMEEEEEEQAGLSAETLAEIAELQAQKAAAVDAEDYDLAKQLKAKIADLSTPPAPEEPEAPPLPPANYGAVYVSARATLRLLVVARSSLTESLWLQTAKSALDFVMEKDDAAFGAHGLIPELEAIRDQIIAGKYADPSKVLADAEKLIRDCAKNPEKYGVSKIYSAKSVADKAERVASFVSIASEKVVSRKWQPNYTAVDTMTLVTDDGAAPYVLAADEQNVLWKRALTADGKTEWEQLSGIPTGPIAMCTSVTEGGAQVLLFSIDMYNCVWCRKLKGDDDAWTLVERENAGKDLTSLAALDGTLYATTKTDKMLTRKIDAAVTSDGTGWEEIAGAEACDVVAMVGLDGTLYASNSSDELWTLDLTASSGLSWTETGGALLPDTAGLCVYKNASATAEVITLVSANFDSLWQRPFGEDR